MPISPFFFGDDSLADSGTAAAILKRGLPPDAPSNGNAIPLFNSAAPTPNTATPVDPTSIPAPDVGQPPSSAMANLPWMRSTQPQPQRPPISTPTGQWAPGTNKAQKLEVMLRDGLQGAIAGYGASANAVVQSGGRRSGGFGLGAAAGYEAPIQQAAQQQAFQRGGLENQLLSTQVQYAPQIQALNFGKTMADIQKNLADAGKATAEGGKATAETGAIPMKSALESAQALAARFKEDPGSGQLIDLQSGQPYGNTAGLAPLSAQEAAVLGKQEGERVPLKLKSTASEIVNRGIKSVSAGGRQLLVDGQGNTIKDLGQATPMAVINAQQAPQQVTPDMQKAIDMVGKNQMDLPTAMMPFRRFPGMATTFLGALHDQYPDYFQGNYGASKYVLQYFTSGEGAKNVNAFNTATEHLGQLQQLASNLGNTRSQAYNAAKNQVETWFGSAAPTNFNLVRSAVAGEIGKTFKGNVTDEEIKSLTSNVNSSQSPGQLAGVINNALSLMRSKMEANVKQYQQGRQAQPAFPSGMTPSGGGNAASQGRPVYRGNQIIGYTTDGKTMTPAGSQ
jgi:hypothetical protein